MPQMQHPNGDVREVPDVLTERYKARGWEPVVKEAPPREEPSPRRNRRRQSPTAAIQPTEEQA